MEEPGAAIWGAGNVSAEHLRAYVNNPDCAVRAIGSRSAQSAEAKRDMFDLDCPIYTDYDAFLADPNIDLFSICTPADNHARETIRGAAAGKHMLIEKPVATSFADLHAMAEAVSRAGVKTVVSFVLRWNEMVANAKSLIAAGALGDVFYVQTDYWHSATFGGNRRGWRSPHAALLMGGCHAVDLARYLMDADATAVTALGFNVNPDNPGTANTAALIEFGNGRAGKVSAITEAGMPYVFNIEVLGTEGAFRNGQLYSALLPGQNDWAEVPSIGPVSGDVAHHPFQGQIDHFVDCAVNDRDSHVDLADAVNTHEVCLAAGVSIERGGEKIGLPFRG
jgi:predicted dehydrogenase